ncbi:pimeloyl-ACP methyl ester esterase BioH [Alkalimonas collagenimarina]|uniref:Pimeloyl-[acyl-carrier protein] methyl ester esterase n=1 Tax=Alkalimonas collagenimarina TaxID=400390 RepID=A0ABT9GX77_9GAMM|nr:pimeloyl-ACP methyl ester esterase BioH [Alkalimonas collagenimarina]MDP4535633.1 pimeloyl-ACP methyl ester esterase BioH [Alkalimonas collagenimarina]
MAVITESRKPSLVLLHGWGMNRAVWQQWLPMLESDWRVTTLDLPGFGQSGQYPEPYQLAAVCQQLETELPESSVLCGWSLGGLVAVALAARYPERVKALVLMAASPCFMAHASWPGMAASLFQKFQQQLSHDINQTIQRFLAIQAMGSPSAREDIKCLRQAILQQPTAQPAALIGGLALLASCDLRHELSALAMPVFAGFGRLDTLVPVSVVDAFRACQPNALIHRFEHASHAPFISHPVEAAEWLYDIQKQLHAQAR